ncbi:helix-turn-helix domain-containing protein [Variovorax paradoxus]|jgi:HTH-type transcriptional regulator/antitoxin HigA|uniref:HTH-type transcriptional regulator/antitoxin HigA n=1 Tax=Variovorax paradoxus TaxID=34073 RepID=A0AAW8E8W8_VARPD|nr:DNA-binding protein [Variovorax paradoxus]MBW8715448.1 transcriptional regulator [Variovorax paradoxus]MBW8890749.1 transcriptional regulator [Burkholderiales bacterium]MDP9969210.1 HTH-type transcriptional regulator/antitoxin HigA [Variovorax paradoxus]
MEVRAIRTDADYRAALREVSALIDLDPDRESPEGERLEVIGTLVQAYEAEHYPVDPPDPIEAIRFRMEQSGLGVRDLVPYIGPLNRVYEVLARKRPLTLHMIRRLNKGLGIPADVLIGQERNEPIAA